MSDAKVQFFGASGESGSKPGLEAQFSFACPRHDRRCGNLLIAGRTGHKRDGQNKNDGVAQWDWDGDCERPTFNPSVDCGGCWHGYIRGGRCVDARGADEPEMARSRT